MKEFSGRALRSAALIRGVAGAGSVLLSLLLPSCGQGTASLRESNASREQAPASPYSLVFLIDGDGNYLFHDTSGNVFKADEKAFEGAERIAERNPRAEVFIYHLIPEDHFLFIFPLPDGEFSYYRNGRLVVHESYRRDRAQSHFGPELELFRRFTANNRPAAVRVFVYCGHEISEARRADYDESDPDRTFTVHELAGAMNGFTVDSTKFDLAVLSTCYGGTPYTIGTIGSSARYVVASPDNLHLSYFDLHPLERLDLSLRDGDVPAFARRFARRSFDRLSEEVETAVSVAVYDVDSVQGYVRSVRALYERSLPALNAGRESSAGRAERSDCGDIPEYVLPSMHAGVEVFFRGAHFGRAARKQVHSGWECWKESEPPDSLRTSILR